MAEVSAIDPNVKVPAAVQRAAARADDIHKQFYTPPEPEGEIEEGKNADAEPEGREKDAAPDPAAAEADAPEPKAKEPEPTEPKPTDTKEVDWESRFKSLQGRVAPLQRENTELRTQLQRLQEQVDILSEQVSSVPEEVERGTYLTDDDRDLVGDDVLDVIGRKTKEELTPYEKKISELGKKVQQLEGLLSKVNESDQRRTEQDVYSTLDREVPDWRELNRDEDFLLWLDLRDQFSGVIRKELLGDALSAGDASRVVSFFKGFKSDQAAVSPAVPTPAPSAAPAPESQDRLTQLAAPGRARASADATPRSPEQTPSFTRAQLSAFYADVQRGRYKGREDEKQKIEQQIFDAQSKGLIRG